MNGVLHKVAFFVGMGALVVSMYWSQDGFNFEIAGDSGYLMTALLIGWFLAFAVTTVQFVFSSNFRELNTTLIFLGALAYGYSIYTNYQGILHFQGSNPNKFAASALAFLMDVGAEPLIAWSLYVSRDGDFLGNIVKTIAASLDRLQQQNSGNKSFNSETRQEKPKSIPFPMDFGKNMPKREDNDLLSDTKPNLHRVNQGKSHKVGYDGKNRPNRPNRH